MRPPSPERLRGYVRWHAELAANAFDTLTLEDAAEHARWRLDGILRYLDGLDDADRSARILNIVGLEIGRDGKPFVRNRDLGQLGGVVGS